MPIHILEDNDRIIDHQPDRKHQRQQRENVDRETCKVVGGEGADDRDRNRQCRNRRRPQTLQECQHHQDDEAQGNGQRLRNFINRVINES